VVDGQENPLQNIWSGRLFEAQDHLALTGHIYNSAYVLVGEHFWGSLAPEDQVLIQQWLDESSRWQLDLMRELDLELEQRLRDEGMQVTSPDKAEFESAARPAYDAIYRRLGPEAPEIVEQIRALR
jgi:TRAP-type C4-dicarboxylate transport system substrate-binding protein